MTFFKHEEKRKSPSGLLATTFFMQNWSFWKIVGFIIFSYDFFKEYLEKKMPLSFKRSGRKKNYD